MTNIIEFGTKTEEPTPTYDYEFTTKDGATFVKHGILTMNPMFYGLVTESNNITFAIAADHVLTVDRREPKPTLNA